MPTIRYKPRALFKPSSCWLTKRSRKIYSQHGEEGIIEAIFEVIGIANKWCVEFGAWDGVHLSNTCFFIKEMHWRAIQIEANPARFRQLVANFHGCKDVFQFNEFVGYNSGVDTLEDLLARTPIPNNFDLLSIDVDGNDYHIWDSISRYKPRLVVIEVNPTIPNDIVFIQNRDMGIRQGSSLAAVVELGKKKGYELVCYYTTNAFFVQTSDYLQFAIDDNSPDAMKRDAPGRIFGCFDGKVYNTLGTLGWSARGQVVGNDALQPFLPHPTPTRVNTK